MLTIKDIAKESGYSISTVSRVLNKRRDVSPKAREEIEKIVAQHGFVPNSNAKQLKQIVSRTIAVVVKGTSNMLFAGLVEEIQSLLAGTKYTVTVSYLDEDDNEVEHALQLCRERNPLGILFLGGNMNFFREKFHSITIPCVLVTNSGKELGFPNLSSVATDDREAGRAAIEYLLKLGHRRIGIIGGDFKTSYPSMQRYQGCVQAFGDGRVEFAEESQYAKARFSYDSAYRAMKRLRQSAGDISAVFAMGDVMAIGAIRALCDEGLRVPEDMSVMGFDGIALSEFYNPKLTTIRQQNHALASRSVEILLVQIERGGDAIHEIAPFHLVEGESTKKR